MGYYPEQIRDLEASINAVPCDAVVVATPMDLRKVVSIHKPATVVSAARPCCSPCAAGSGSEAWLRAVSHSRRLGVAAPAGRLGAGMEP